MDLLLTGKTIDAKRAKRVGLADQAVPLRIFREHRPDAHARGAEEKRIEFPEQAHARPAQGSRRVAREKRAREEGEAGALPGPLRDRRHLAEVRRQRARGPGRASRLDPEAHPASHRKSLVRIFFLQER